MSGISLFKHCLFHYFWHYIRYVLFISLLFPPTRFLSKRDDQGLDFYLHIISLFSKDRIFGITKRQILIIFGIVVAKRLNKRSPLFFVQFLLRWRLTVEGRWLSLTVLILFPSQNLVQYQMLSLYIFFKILLK